MDIFLPGQRWFSTAEPELGLGTVLRPAARSVQIVFTGTGVVRQYAIGSAPLLRAIFRPGERVRSDGEEYVVERVEDVGGLARYHVGAGKVITIPTGTAHRVRNDGDAPLVFVEVQTGEYFGEDDIVRLEDDYGRADA